jgi:hypothetical protein
LVYVAGEAIQFTFANEAPTVETWIGIYPARYDGVGLPNPKMWLWACEDDSNGDSGCSDPSGTITFDAITHLGDLNWPLCNGEWKAFLSNDQTPSYLSLASTAKFLVEGSSCEGVCGLATTAPSVVTHAIPVDQTEVSNVAFGSCYRRLSKPTDILWQHVRKSFEADVWNWLGDNVYSDSNSMEYKRIAYNSGGIHAHALSKSCLCVYSPSCVATARENQIYQEFGPIAEPKIPTTGTWVSVGVEPAR